MPVKYNLSEKGKPGDRDAAKKFYANAKSSGEVKGHIRKLIYL